MAKLKLQPAPTFKAKVVIPAPGAPIEIVFEFLHKTKKGLEEFATGDKAKDRSDVETVLEIAKGWDDVEEEFGKEAIAGLCENYHAAARSIADTYMRELTQARLGN